MPDDKKEPPKEGDKRKLGKHLFTRLGYSLFNWFGTWPGIRNLPGMGKVTKEARAVGRMQEEEIIKDLRPLFILNEAKITTLKRIEKEWYPLLDDIVFKGVEQHLALVNVYKAFGLYNDVALAQTEANGFIGGTYEVETRTVETPIGRIEIPRIITDKPFFVKLSWERFGSSGFHEENLYAFGHAKINELKGTISLLRQAVEKVGQDFQPNVAARGTALDAITLLNNALSQIQQIEEEHFNYLNGVIPQIQKIEGIKTLVDQHRPDPRQIRFSHTHKVVKPFILVEIQEKVKRLSEDDRVVEEERTSLRQAYFNPIKNPYTEELEKINEKIRALGGNNEREIARLDNAIGIRKRQIAQKEEAIKAKKTEIIKRFKEELLNELSEEFREDIAGAPNSRERIADVGAYLDRLADSPEEVENKIKEFFDLLQREMAGLGLEEAAIRRFVDRWKEHFNRVINDDAIKRLQTQRLLILQNFENIKTQRKERLDLVFRKEQLEFYIGTLKPNHPNFTKADDEIDWGLDENGQPLEVDPKTGEILLDRWWKELSEHPTGWHEKIVKEEKPGGKEVWKAKVDDGVKKHGIRVVDKKFITDVDALDMAMFVYNEWDSFRDDFRDGRYHPHSKTIMDYLMASNKGVMPKENIPTDFDPIKDYKTFDPERDVKNKLPDDEKQVTQVYQMKVFNTATNAFELKEGKKVPTHLNPAFDRAALHVTASEESKLYGGFLHWGRMYYYETPDGITRWTENPFPHVSTRGLAKYLIDNAIRKSYKFEDARNALKGKEWDYGRRHYTPDAGPYITDPLGEGGVAPPIP